MKAESVKTIVRLDEIRYEAGQLAKEAERLMRSLESEPELRHIAVRADTYKVCNWIESSNSWDITFTSIIAQLDEACNEEELQEMFPGN